MGITTFDPTTKPEVNPWLNITTVDPDYAWAWKGLKALWPLWEGGGGVVRNIARPFLSAGTFNNDPTWVNTAVGHAVRFDGGNDRYLDLGDPQLAIAGYPYTLFCYVDGTDGSPINLSDIAVINVLVELRFTGGVWTFDRRNTTDRRASGGALSGRFQLIVGVARHATLAELYVDGVLVGTNTDSVTWNSSMDTTTLGAFQRSTGVVNEFNGDLAFAGLYNRALTATEIAQWHRDPFGPFRKAPRRIGKAPVVVPGVVGGAYYQYYARNVATAAA